MRKKSPRQPPDARYIHLIQKGSVQPIFIVGDHRSGSTLLYQLLAFTQHFNVVTAYHILKYDELLSNHLNRVSHRARQQIDNRFKELGLIDRIIDRVKVNPDLPEEYGFILRNGGYKAQIRPKTLPTFLEICQKIQFISNPGRPLLLKNPWDVLNFMYIKQIFPQARFIFIHRNPIHTINSQLRTIRSLFSSKNPYVALIAGWYNQLFDRPVQLYLFRLLFSARFEIGFKIVRRHVTLATTYFLKNIARLPEADVMCLTYEALCQEPESTIASLLSFLQLPETVPAGTSPFIQVRPARLLDEVERNKPALIKRLAPYLNYCGYDL